MSLPPEKMKDVQLESNPSHDLTNMELFQFIGSQLSHIDALGDVATTDPKFKEILMENRVQHQEMDRILIRVRESSKSKELMLLNKRRSTSYRAFTASLKAKAYSLDPQEKAAVAELFILLKPYGNVARLSFDVLSGALDNIVAELEGAKYAPMVELLGLMSLVLRFKADNNAFKELYSARNADSFAWDTTDMREVRNRMYILYNTLCDYAVVMARMNANQVFDNIIVIINTIRAHYNALVTRKQSSRKKADMKKKDAADKQDEKK